MKLNKVVKVSDCINDLDDKGIEATDKVGGDLLDIIEKERG